VQGCKADAASRLGAVAPRKEVSKGGGIGRARFERNLRHGSRNGSKNASFEIREASRSRAFDSPSPGEHKDV